MAHANRTGQDYPTAAQLVVNLPMVLRALCDHLLDAHPDAMDVARRRASVIDAVENVPSGPGRAKNENSLHGCGQLSHAARPPRPVNHLRAVVRATAAGRKAGNHSAL